MAELAKLKAQRAAIKCKVTRFKNYFESIDKETVNDEIINELQIRLERVQPVDSEFDEIQFQIEQLVGENDEAERNEFENKYFQLVGNINSVINKYNKESSSDGSVVSSRHSAANSNAVQSLVKLPPIKLPTFDGQYGNWLEFKDSFIALVDGNNALNDIQKFYYLRSSLSKEVFEIIKSIEVSDANYKIAWQFLTDRFENKKLIIYNHIRAIFEHPSIMNESYKDLRNLYDSITKHLRSLDSMGENTDTWDRLIIYIMSSKFDPTTRRDWETYKYASDLPTMSDLNKFLKEKCEILEKLEVSNNNEETCKYKYSSKRMYKHGHSNSFQSTDNNKPDGKFRCYFCNQQSHSIFKCNSFLKLAINDRINAVKQLKLCLNCIRDSHPSWKCTKPKCFKCKKAHNTLLHLEIYKDEHSGRTDGENNLPLQNPEIPETTSSFTQGNGQNQDGSVSLNSHTADCAVAGSKPFTVCAEMSTISSCSQVLLSTAIIQVTNGTRAVTARALLDSGSQSNFISQNICNKLGLNQIKINHAVKGVGQALTNINKKVNLTIKSCVNNYKSNISCLVLPRITDKLPIMSFNKDILKIPSILQLADPNFNVSAEIDILLGSSIFWSIVGVNQVRLGPKMPILQETKFGYIIAGDLNLNLNLSDSSVSCLNILDSDAMLDKKMVKFWEIEEINNKVSMSDSEKYCEKYFSDTISRDASGRFIVKVPFKNNLESLGDSRSMALNRFHLLERKFAKNSSLKSEYATFMTEYQSLGHMSEIDDTVGEGYYLPHHAVLKTSSLTTKCRVVFDASAKTSSGLSLNDVQFSGPTLQQDVFSILARFRIHQYVMTGDIAKMYRQILINPDELKYQKIFWRAEPEENIKVFQLNTVTYGTASAPYLAVRCLIQIATENEVNFPVASKIIKRDFYMDDLLTGSSSMSELLDIQKNIVKLLASYGFELRKFLCNNKELLGKFETNKDLDASILNIGANEPNKTLGVYWDASNDFIRYKININDNFCDNKLTKRTILSLICQIFDPLGVLGPIIIMAKLIMQELWKLKIDWDDEVPQNLLNTWSTFYNNLFAIRELKIPRCITISRYVSIELHGFCDASIKAYGACIYVRCLSVDGKFYSNLLCAKSRVAPLKQISLPRLELCGAQLLANLTNKLLEVLDVDFNKLCFWTDSQITLCWIQNESRKWKTFVANRVSEIRSLTNFQDWHYVKSSDNPADLLSRGSTVEVFNKSRLWWHGPDWLLVNTENWNVTEPDYDKMDAVPEQKSVSCSIIIRYSNEILSVLKKFSSFTKTLRVLAYILRFVTNIKLKHNVRIYGPLLPEEVEGALNVIIKNVQIECFPEEYTSLTNKKELNKSSKILSLNPFLQNGIMRVGGRVKNSSLPFENKHPIILPSSHFLTKQILRQEHERLLHCGIQNLLYAVRERYWPISGRNACKNIVRNCVRCFRVAPRDSNYLMGDLPEVRVTPHSVFLNVGTDYGGPFLLKDRQTRNAKIIKAYMCIFVCMSTKAIHIELVSELTTQAFLAALSRFVSRRGKPANIYSDNGSNYKGANTELSKIYEFLTNQSDNIANQLTSERIKWHFIPASSPSFGGLWEAGIKSAKSHIKRVIGENRLTFEEYATVLTQIEGILNSRPLCPLTQDPDDLSALTPGHFLVGKPLTSLPEIGLTEVPENRLTKWKHLQYMTQHFWRRWQKEYLSELQTRVKWRRNSTNLIKIGTLVLIKNDNAPSMYWQLGRVIALHPGKDGVTRVVKLKVNNGELTRAINRVCALPIQ